jgi:hypothetical protein
MNADLFQSPAYQEIFRQVGWIVEDLGGVQVGYVARLKFLPLVSVMGIPRVEDPIALSLADQVARRYRSLVVRVAPKEGMILRLTWWYGKECLKEREGGVDDSISRECVMNVIRSWMRIGKGLVGSRRGLQGKK